MGGGHATYGSRKSEIGLTARTYDAQPNGACDKGFVVDWQRGGTPTATKERRTPPPSLPMNSSFENGGGGEDDHLISRHKSTGGVVWCSAVLGFCL